MTASSSCPTDAPVGMPYADYAGLDDPVIEIAVTPNRGDALACAASRATWPPPGSAR